MKSVPYLPFVCIIVCICGWLSTASAQTPLADSLHSVITDPAFNEKEKPAVLNQLAEVYRAGKDYTLAATAARQCIALSLKHQNHREATRAYAMLANIKFNQQQYADLKKVVDSVFAVAQSVPDPVAMAYAYYTRVLLYKTLGNSDDVVKYCQLGLRQLDKEPDPYIAAKIYYQLYVVYSGWNNEEKVDVYARAATASALKTSD